MSRTIKARDDGEPSRNTALAVRPRGNGDVTATHRLWFLSLPNSKAYIGSGVILAKLGLSRPWSRIVTGNVTGILKKNLGKIQFVTTSRLFTPLKGGGPK